MFHSGVDNYRDIPIKRSFAGKVNVLASIDQFVKLSTTTNGARGSPRCQSLHEDNSSELAQKEENGGSYHGYWQIHSTKIRKEGEHRSPKSSCSASRTPLLKLSKTGLLKTPRPPLLPFPPEHQVQGKGYSEWMSREYKSRSETSWGTKLSTKPSYQEQQRQKHLENERDYKARNGTSYGSESTLCTEEACRNSRSLRYSYMMLTPKDSSRSKDSSQKEKRQHVLYKKPELSRKSFRGNSSDAKGFSSCSEKKRTRSADDQSVKTKRCYRHTERRPRSLSKHSIEHSSETEGSSKHSKKNQKNHLKYEKCVIKHSSDTERSSRQKERTPSKRVRKQSFDTEQSSRQKERSHSKGAVKQEDHRKDNIGVSSVTTGSKDLCFPVISTANAAVAKSNHIKQGEIKQDHRKDNFGVSSVTTGSKDLCFPVISTANAALAKSNHIKQECPASQWQTEKPQVPAAAATVVQVTVPVCLPETSSTPVGNHKTDDWSNIDHRYHKETSLKNVVEFQQLPSSQYEGRVVEEIVELASPVYPDPNESYSFDDEPTDYLETEDGLNERHFAILEKRDELEEAFKQQCTVYFTVVSALVEKDPSLEESIQPALRASLSDLTNRCVRELEEFIEEYDSGNVTGQSEH